MRLLITGGLGLIGSAIAEQAIAAGHDVVIVDDGRAGVVPYVDRAQHYTQAIEDYAGRDPIDVVIHAAAPVGPVGILGRNVLEEMTRATEAAVDVAYEHGAALVAFSSSEVYGTTEPGASLVVPDDWSHRTEYAVGKIVTEQIARRHQATTGLRTAVIRPWNVTGAVQAASKGFVFPRMAAQAVAGEPITVYAPGHQRRAFMAVGDLAEAVVELVSDPHAAAWGAVPIDAASPQNAVSMEQLAWMFAAHELSATRSVVVVDPRDEHGPDFREAAAGTKLPPAAPAMAGGTPLFLLVAEALQAAYIARGHEAAAA